MASAIGSGQAVAVGVGVGNGVNVAVGWGEGGGGIGVKDGVTTPMEGVAWGLDTVRGVGEAG